MREPARFTLLELMISMALLAVMMAMTYSAFSTAMSAVLRRRRRGSRRPPAHRDVDADSPGPLDRQLPCVHRGRRGASLLNTDPKFCPEGASVLLVHHQLAPAERRRGARLGHLLDRWQHPLDGRASDLLRGAISGDAPDPTAQTVPSRAQGGEPQHLRLEGDDSQWLSSWDALEEQALPGAIRVTLDGVGTGGSYWIQEIPIMTVVYGSATTTRSRPRGRRAPGEHGDDLEPE
jgi:prepilin-type N-terminal cleavage/methylation domain-containing protein